MLKLRRHSYRYYPYELELARREVSTLLPTAKIEESENGIRLLGAVDRKIADRLVYFASIIDDEKATPTLQAQLERVNGDGAKRQSTRYSAHGLHEYKGKFNPQVVRAILNILDMPVGARVIDPFCGSGTSLLECAHIGMRAIGTDINPLAVFIANAKLTAVCLPAAALRQELRSVLKRYETAKPVSGPKESARRQYLLAWFDADVFKSIERLRTAINKGDKTCSGPLLAVASNLLRDYSLQDPNDLRIRRWKTPRPEKPFLAAFEDASVRFCARMQDAQSVLRRSSSGSKAILLDSRDLRVEHLGTGARLFDCALTSPPYATALPYIDTQRLSLVGWG